MEGSCFTSPHDASHFGSFSPLPLASCTRNAHTGVYSVVSHHTVSATFIHGSSLLISPFLEMGGCSLILTLADDAVCLPTRKGFLIAFPNFLHRMQRLCKNQIDTLYASLSYGRATDMATILGHYCSSSAPNEKAVGSDIPGHALLQVKGSGGFFFGSFGTRCSNFMH